MSQRSIKQRDNHRDTVNRFQWAKKNCTRQSGHQKVRFFDQTKRTTGEDTYAGALRAPRAGSPDCVFVFVFVFVYIKFELRKDLTLPSQVPPDTGTPLA